MQVTEDSVDGLKRKYSVVITAADMERRLDGKLQTVSQSISMPGFRPGKVPPSLVKKIHGKSVAGEVLEEAVRESTEQLLKEKELRPAVQPKVEIKDYQEGADLTYEIAFEVLPDISLPDFSKIELERWVADIPDAKIKEVLDRLASQNKSFEDKGAGAAAATGDAIVIDFIGTVDGEAFEGGTAKDHQLELGSQSFLPGFEDQLIGVKAGDSKDVKVTFPDDYPAQPMAGKDAVFKIDVTAVKRPIAVEINDDLAKQLGMESLDALKAAVREQAVREHDNTSRARLKRSLLDALFESQRFDVPESMLEMEFQQIWGQVEQDMARQEVDPESDPAVLEEMKEEYKGIAKRRVLLGLLLAEVGRKNHIQVTQDETSRALTEEARRHPGQERQIYEYFQNTPEALARLQAPLLEEKSVDFILELATITERKVSHDELVTPPSEDSEPAPSGKTKSKSGKAAKKAAAPKAKSTGSAKGKAKSADAGKTKTKKSTGKK